MKKFMNLKLSFQCLGIWSNKTFAKQNSRWFFSMSLAGNYFDVYIDDNEKEKNTVRCIMEVK